MRKLVKALCFALVLCFALSCFACDVGLSRKTPTADRYFNFELLADGTYAISVKDKLDIPEQVILPSEYEGKAVTKIDLQGFANTNITKIAIPDGYTTICGYAFENCHDLKTIEFGNTLLTFEQGAFSGCTGLVNTLLIPSSVTVIGNRCFELCTSLLVIDIPETCSLGVDVFVGCNQNLTVNRV